MATVAPSLPEYRLVPGATDDLIAWVKATQSAARSPFEAAQAIVGRLGAHYRDGQAEVGFWAPEVTRDEFPAESVFLELWTPLEAVDLQANQQRVRFRRERIPLQREGEFLWGVISGMSPGTRKRLGTLYRAGYEDRSGTQHTIPDYLAYSLPFGSFAPAEFYDVGRLDRERQDREYFSKLDAKPDPDGVPRIQPPSNILQIHVSTGSGSGTLAGLADVYGTIAEKIRADEPLSPAEKAYVGYDAVQLMPIAPTVEYESGPLLWQPLKDVPATDTVVVNLRSPDMTNWGYDVLLFAMSAINPAILGSGRPDELVDLITTLHAFPTHPIKVIFDVVYGHIDNQALPLLNERFVAGPGMYGQNVNFRDLVVRALLLEMQRRKHNYGVDGVRVDGAQDFQVWDSETGRMHHDDDYLRLMNDVVQEVAGQRYRPWMIFEDGRPWPRDDWELASTYREVTKQLPNVFQWGPLTFAHNTPFLFTFWISKWWRIREMAGFGSKWITGCANHDTLRRGTQVNTDARINSYLGDSLPEIFKQAYDNPASKLFHYAFMPGVPMDFINASVRAPWAFIRNTDDKYSVKVVSQESGFLDWVVDEELYARERTFARLTALGFAKLEELRRFMCVLDHAVQATDYQMEGIISLLDSVVPPLEGHPFSANKLKLIARAWMDDVHEICNVSRHANSVDPDQAEFNLAVREFRRARPWLRENLRAEDHVDYVHPAEGTALFHGLRHAPDWQEQVLFVANMEGEPLTVVPEALPVPTMPRGAWFPTLVAPGVEVESANQPVELEDGQGVVFTRSSQGSRSSSNADSHHAVGET